MNCAATGRDLAVRPFGHLDIDTDPVHRSTYSMIDCVHQRIVSEPQGADGHTRSLRCSSG